MRFSLEIGVSVGGFLFFLSARQATSAHVESLVAII